MMFALGLLIIIIDDFVGGEGGTANKARRVRISFPIQTNNDRRPVPIPRARTSTSVDMTRSAWLDFAVVVGAEEVGATRPVCGSVVDMQFAKIKVVLGIRVEGVGTTRTAFVSKRWSVMSTGRTE